MKIGDIVALKSGGINMTVSDLLEYEVVCVYYNRVDGKISTCKLSKNVLVVNDDIGNGTTEIAPEAGVYQTC
jgi:uncharacterized protein YodC (DUF2158 family)